MQGREPNEFEFDVAISFAGEDRVIAEKIAVILLDTLKHRMIGA